MVPVSFDDICRHELGLNALAQTRLKTDAKLFQKVWNTDNSKLYNRNENNTYKNDMVQSRIASAYLESGWNSGETHISPGKIFWQNSDIDDASAKYRCPRDKKRIKEGLVKLFTKIQEGQGRYQRMRAGKEQRNFFRELDSAELSDSDYLGNSDTWGTQAFRNKDMKDSAETAKQLTSIPHESVGDNTELEQLSVERSLVPIQDDGPETFQCYKSVKLSFSSEKGSTDEHPATCSGQISSIGILGARSCRRPVKQNVANPHPQSSPASPLQTESSSDVTNFGIPSFQSPNGDGGVNPRRRIQKFRVSGPSLSRIINEKPSGTQKNRNDGAPRNSLRQSLERKVNESSSRKHSMDFQTSEGAEISPPKRSKARKPAIKKSRRENFGERYSAGQSPGPSTRDTATQILNIEALRQKDPQQNQAEDHQPSFSQHETDNDALTPTQGCFSHIAHQSSSAPRTDPFIHFFFLESRSPESCWMSWQDAKLAELTIGSVFGAVSKYSKMSCDESLVIKFIIPKAQYVFRTSRRGSDYFDHVKQFIIDKSQQTFQDNGSGGIMSIQIIPS